jgi:hypothetical protein
MLEKRVLWSWFEVINWLAQRNAADREAVAEARVLAAFNRFIENQRAAVLDADVSRFAASLARSAMVERLRALRGEGEKTRA